MGRCACCKKLTTEKGITFHRFPSDEIERKKWVQNMGRPDWLPAKTAVLCSNHFTSDCFERWWNITRLRKGSVPTIFPENTIVGQASNKRLKVDPSTPTASSSPSASTSRTSCAKESNSVEAILPTLSPEISTPICPVSTPKSSTCRKQLTPRTLRWQELVQHDHHYEDTPRTSQKKLNLIREKYASSQKKIKALKRQVNNLKTTVYSLKKVIEHLKASQHMRVAGKTNNSNTKMLLQSALEQADTT